MYQLTVCKAACSKGYPACALAQTLVCRQVEEVLQLRRGECWRASGLQVYSEASTPLEGMNGSALDVTIVLERCVHCFMRQNCSKAGCVSGLGSFRGLSWLQGLGLCDACRARARRQRRACWCARGMRGARAKLATGFRVYGACGAGFQRRGRPAVALVACEG